MVVSEAPLEISASAANCEAPAYTNNHIATGSHIGNPALTAISPNTNDTVK
ncbi:hypothetical protein D3C78_1945360 [compost metagenome]